VLAVVGQYGADVTKDTCVEDLPYDVESGQEEGPQRLGAEQAALRGQSGDLRGLGGVECEGLLHERVLAGREGDPGAVEVAGVLGAGRAEGKAGMLRPPGPGRRRCGPRSSWT